MITYKVDIIKLLNERGYTLNDLRRRGIIAQGTLQKIRNNDTSLTLDNMNRLCILLKCQISDLLEVQTTDEEKIKYF